jgi:hypothetical protein
MPPGLEQAEASKRRMAITAKVVRMKAGENGLLLKEVLALLRQLHEAGKWPQSEAAGARNEPYDCGTRQHLASLVNRGEVVVVRDDRSYDRYFPPDPAKLLPKNPRRFETAIMRARASGIRDVVLGVTEDCRRVIRIDTGRGEIEHWLRPGETWELACKELGIAV